MKDVILEESRSKFHRIEAKILSIQLTSSSSEITFVILKKQQILFQSLVSSDITQHLCLKLTQNKQMSDINYASNVFLVLSHLIHNDYLLTNIIYLIMILDSINVF